MKEMSRKVLGWILFLLWLYFIVYLTIIHRKQGETASYNLHLFWCIKDAWRSRNPVNWYFVIANIGVFIPLGMILPICFPYFQNIWKVTAAGFCISVSIELTQLCLHRGFFEFDDMFNNALGTLLGYGFFLLFCHLFHFKTQATDIEKRIIAGVWAFVILFIIVALLFGQPVFENFGFYVGKYIFIIYRG